MDNTWLCIKKLEGHPGKIYFEGCVTEQSRIEEVSDSSLGSFVIKVSNLKISDERQSSVSQSQSQVQGNDEGTVTSNHLHSDPVSLLDIGFDTSEDMTLWWTALQGQVSLCGE